MNRVLFVCLGNICRSPAAEGIFKKLVETRGLSDHYFCDSAGTSGDHNGELPDSRMRRHAEMRGYALTSLSRKFQMSDFDQFDYILVMDHSIEAWVRNKVVNKEDHRKIFQMVSFGSQSWGDEVIDPWYGGAKEFELVLSLLEDCCTGLLKYIEGTKHGANPRQV